MMRLCFILVALTVAIATVSSWHSSSSYVVDRLWRTSLRRLDRAAARTSTDRNVTAEEFATAKQKGPNVCAKRIPSSFWGQCHLIDGKSKCTRNIKYRTYFTCCDGFAQAPMQKGCPRALFASNKTIVEAMEHLGLTDLLTALNASGTLHFLRGTEHTILAPSQAAFEAIGEKSFKSLLDDPKELSKLLLYHIAPGMVKLSDIKDEESLPSLLSPYNIRTTRFSRKKLVFAQGARIVTANVPFNNGLIHVIDKVLSVPTTKAEKILKGRKDLDVFDDALTRSGLDLSPANTILAPTNAAFKKIPVETLRRVTSRPECLKNLLANHLLRFSIYSGIVDQGTTAFANTMARRRMLFGRTNNTFTVGDAVAIDADLGSVDKVVHVIDKVQVPHSALDVASLAEALGASKFATSLRLLGLDSALISSNSSYTLFVPSDEAFSKLSREEVLDLTDSQTLDELLRYHVVSGIVGTKDVTKDQRMETLSTFGDIRFNRGQSRKVVTVNGARIDPKQRNIAGCKSIIHIIDRVLPRPIGSLLDAIESKPELSRFAALLRKADLNATVENTDPLTVFAPTNDALDRESLDLESLSPANLNATLKGYILPETAFTRQLPSRCSLTTLHGSRNAVLRQNGDVFVGGAKLIEPDVMATNGVLHVLGNVMELVGPSSYSVLSRYHRWFYIG